jgi:hypothetical protein
MTAATRDYYAIHPEQIPLARSECESWRGTPFRKNSAIKGPNGGIDCKCFLASVFFSVGAIPAIVATAAYEVNQGEHSDASELLAWFELPEVKARTRRLDEAEASLDGDIVFPRVGRSVHHIGLRFGNDVYHITRLAGWCCMTVGQLDAMMPRALRHLRGLHPSRYRLLVPA